MASGLSSVTNQWVKLKIKVAGAASSVRITSWLNDAPVHDCTTTSSTIATGSVGRDELRKLDPRRIRRLPRIDPLISAVGSGTT